MEEKDTCKITAFKDITKDSDFLVVAHVEAFIVGWD
jgi:hypothetical protein